MARIYALDPATQALPETAKAALRADFPSKADIEAAGYLKDATAFAPALGRRFSFGTAAPTAGTWQAGDLVVNQTPTSGAPSGWVCTTGGTPGTWTPLAPVNILGSANTWTGTQTFPSSGGPVLTSANGTRYRLGVADDGSLTTTSL